MIGVSFRHVSRGVIFVAATPTLIVFRLPSFVTARDERIHGDFACRFEVRSSMQHSRWTTVSSTIALFQPNADCVLKGHAELLHVPTRASRRKSSVGGRAFPIYQPIINGDDFEPFQRRNWSATISVRLYFGQVQPGAAITTAIIVDYRRSEYTVLKCTPMNGNELD